jgi:hypothetical protein
MIIYKNYGRKSELVKNSALPQVCSVPPGAAFYARPYERTVSLSGKAGQHKGRFLLMKKNKLFVFGMLILTFTLILAGCGNLTGGNDGDSNDDGSNNGGSNGGSITWTQVADDDHALGGVGGAFTDNQFRDAAWGNDRFVVVGYTTNNSLSQVVTGKIAYSSDGISWTEADLSASTYRYINGVAWGNNKFVAVGSEGTITHSTDGVTWTKLTITGSLSKVAWGNDKFVAVGLSGLITYSSDGVTWTPVSSSPFTTSINAIAWGNGQWFAVGDSGKMASSTDGITWTPVSPSPFGTYKINAITWGDSKWVAAGSAAFGGEIVYSSDGTSWTDGSHPFSFSGATIQSIAWSNGKWFAIGSGGLEGGRMAYSTDGVTWTLAYGDILDPSNPFKGANLFINGIAYGGSAGNKRFIAVGGAGISNPAKIWYSNAQ